MKDFRNKSKMDMFMNYPSVSLFNYTDWSPHNNWRSSDSLPSMHKCLQQSASAISWSTIFGSASVLVSPSSFNCLEAIFLKILLIIFPLLVFGRPGAQWILSGAANAPIWNVKHFSSVRPQLINFYIRLWKSKDTTRYMLSLFLIVQAHLDVIGDKMLILN